jgi:hypothetical protein
MASTSVNKPQEARPFALSVINNRNGTSGMTIPKAVGELVDNAFDANGSPRFKLIHSDDKDSLLIWNLGDNCDDLSRVLSLSKITSQKSEDKIGLMNAGGFASVCCFEPDTLIFFSRTSDKDEIELTWNYGNHIKAIDASRDNYNDPSLTPSNFMETSRITKKTSKILESYTSKIHDSKMRKEYHDLITTGPQGLLMVMEFGKAHRLYNTLDTHFAECLPTLNLYHADILKNRNATIIFENSKNIPTILDGATAIDLMCDYKCIRASVEVRSTVKEDLFEITLCVDGESTTHTYWITNVIENKTFYDSQPLFEKPARWDKMNPVGSFKVNFTCLSKNDDKKQLTAIKGDYDKNAELIRGVMIKWNGRRLGVPWWPKLPISRRQHWGAKCNAGPLRFEIDISNSHKIINMLNIQTDKGVINLQEAHVCMLRLLDDFMKVAKDFTSTHKNAEAKGNLDWKPAFVGTDVFNLMKKSKDKGPTNKKESPPSSVVSTPSPTPVKRQLTVNDILTSATVLSVKKSNVAPPTPPTAVVAPTPPTAVVAPTPPTAAVPAKSKVPAAVPVAVPAAVPVAILTNTITTPERSRTPSPAHQGGTIVPPNYPISPKSQYDVIQHAKNTFSNLLSTIDIKLEKANRNTAEGNAEYYGFINKINSFIDSI